MSEAPAIQLSETERSAILDRVIASQTANGWRVTSQSSHSAQFEKGKHTSHVLHLILTLLTAGLWLIVWIIVALAGGHKQRHVFIAEDGRAVWT